LAREAADKFRNDGRPRFVFGSIGPGTRLPSLGQVDYDALLAAYPACPNLEDQGQVMELLGAGRIGVQLSDEAQLHPEQSTSAIVVHHPTARYFTV
jgi:hypothetical protein